MRMARIGAGTVLVTGLLLGPATVAHADRRVCDAYSGTCTTVPSSTVQGEQLSKPPSGGDNLTLPFTGGEIVLMSVAGLGAVGAGGALVAGARRRRRRSPA